MSSSIQTTNTTSTTAVWAHTTVVCAYQWNPYKEEGGPHFVRVPRSYFHESHRVVNTTTRQQHRQQPPKSPYPSSDTSMTETGLSTPASSGESTPTQNTTTLSSPASVIQAPTWKFLDRPTTATQVYPVDDVPFLPAAVTGVQVPKYHHRPNPAPIQAHTTAAPNARDLLRLCLAQPYDSMVVTKLHSLDAVSIRALFDLLLGDGPFTVKTLMQKERGNVVVQIFSIPCAQKEFRPELDALFQHIASLYPVLAKDKQGALALTRFYDAIPKDCAYRHTFDTLTLVHMDQIVGHPFGNFLVSQFIKSMSTATTENRASLASIFCNPAKFAQISMDRWGSHTSEIWASECPTAEFCQTIRALVHIGDDALMRLANSIVGNNPLQRLIVRMYHSRESCPQCDALYTECLDGLLARVEGAHFQRMVGASLRGRARALQA